MKHDDRRLHKANRPMVTSVLLVESHADLRAVISSALIRADYDCDAVSTPAAALLKIREHDYAFIVVDVEATQSIAPLRDALDAEPDLHGKIVYITEDDDPAALHKPFDMAALLAHLR
jgi:CheY-like chemotaxis protein